MIYASGRMPHLQGFYVYTVPGTSMRNPAIFDSRAGFLFDKSNSDS